MRGIAAAIVVFHHTFTRLPELFSGSIPPWLWQIFEAVSEMNVQAVLFFFFLSGFSIRLSVRNELPVTPGAFNNYVYRRLKRIAPLYYFAIFFTFCAGMFTNSIAGNKDYSVLNLFGNLFFLQCSKSYAGNWFAPYGENGPLWSLSFEIFYYFLLPPFLLLLPKIFKTKTMSIQLNRISLVIALFISLGCVAVNKFFFFPFVAFATLFYVWYAGFFAATLYLEQRIKVSPDLLLLVFLTAILLLINYTVPSATSGKLLFGSFVAASFIPMFILRKKIQPAFKLCFELPLNFLFYRIGTGSYALYLLHFPVILMLKHFNCRSLPVVAFTLVATSICCIWLEQLFSKRKWLLLQQQYIK